jgi:hypothetical protein
VGEGEQEKAEDFQSPSPSLGEGFGVRAFEFCQSMRVGQSLGKGFLAGKLAFNPFFYLSALSHLLTAIKDKITSFYGLEFR